jgi:hypothetical protein
MRAGMNYFNDDVVMECVNDILDLLDYMDLVDSTQALLDRLPPLPSPPPLQRQLGSRLNPIDLTSELEEEALVSVPTRLDFTLVVDEVENGGYFGRSAQA